MPGTAGAAQPYREIVNDTGRVFRVGEDPKTLLGYPRWVVILAAWLAVTLAGVLEYTWGALAGSLQALHGWSNAPTFWLFSCYVISASLVQPVTGYLREHGTLSPRWATVIGGVICGVVAYGWLSLSTQIWEAYVSYVVLGGIGSGMVYSSCINIVAKWYPEKKGWRIGFVNGGWAYGCVPFVVGITVAFSRSGTLIMSPAQISGYIVVQGIVMTVVVVAAAFFLKDPPRSWWPDEVSPLDWAKSKRSTRDLLSNPPALRQYTVREMWYTPQAKWVSLQFALYVCCSLFGVAYYFVFAQEMNLGAVAVVAGIIGFSLSDGLFRPICGYVSEYVGRRQAMYSVYALSALLQMLTLACGLAHLAVPFAICAVVSGGLSGANFPLTAALTADYWGEAHNAVNYGSVQAWRALGGRFAGGLATRVMTGTLYDTVVRFNWGPGFVVGASLGLLAAVVVFFECRRPTVEQMRAAVEKASPAAEPAVAAS